MKAPREPGQHDEMLEVLRDRMVAWVRDGTARILLAQPPCHALPGIEIVPHKIPLLAAPARRRTHQSVGTWPKAGLAAVRNPYFGCVLEGEADFCIGVTARMARENPALKNAGGRQ